MTSFQLAGMVLAVVSATAGAQSSANGRVLNAEVTSIRESRGVNDKCEVGLKFTGEILTNYCSVLGVRPTRATDDAGRDICPTNGTASFGWSTGGNVGFTALRGWHQERPSHVRFGNVSLRGSSRAARAVKVLEGEVELYMPTLENGGVVIVENFRSQPGAKLSSPVLEKMEIRLVYHTKESFESAPKPAGGQKAPGFSVDYPMSEDESSLFPGILNNPESAPGNYVVLDISDPDGQLVGFAFLGPDGRFVPTAKHRSVNRLRGFYFVPPVLPEKLDLYVYVAAPGAVKSVPFRLENIPLP